MADLRYVQGLSDLADALRTLGERVARNSLRSAVSSGAVVIRDEAKRLAPMYTGKPKEGHPPPGTLKRAIFIKRERGNADVMSAQYSVFVRQAYNEWSHQGRKNVKAYGKFDAFYWKFVEFGTCKMTAKPFMRPAFEGQKLNALQAIQDKLADRIKTEVTSHAGGKA